METANKNKNLGTIKYEEEQLMAIYNLMNDAGTRQGLIDIIADMAKDINPEIPSDVELQGHVEAVLAHLRNMSDEEFSNLDLTVDFPS